MNMRLKSLSSVATLLRSLIGICAMSTLAMPLLAIAAQPTLFSSEFAVPQVLAAPPAGVVDLRFRDFFRMPVGPKGLEPSEKLRALDGKKVRIVGFMVQQEQPTANRFILTHLPVSMSEDEDGLADDLPPNVVFVHAQHTPEMPLKHLPGLLQFSGTLSVGPKEEADGRVSSVRLLLDRPASEALLTVSRVSENTKH
jgi:hypothetical protein